MTRRTAGGLGSHLALCFILRAHSSWIKNTLQATFIVSKRCEELISFITMAPANRFVSPPLLHGVCFQHAAEQCFRTTIGSRCLMLPCQDFSNGYHFSHSCHCLLICGSPTLAPAQRRLPSNSSTINSTMACLKHRMRSRRGGSHGDFNRSRASTSSTSDSPDSTTELPNSLMNPTHSYPNIKSGRGWRNNDVHTVDLPLPPLFGPHNTQFRFCSSLYRPTITATITISFEEVSATPATLSSRGNKQNKAEPGS